MTESIFSYLDGVEMVMPAQKHGLTPNEAVTLAAIVQKESLKNDERPLIAQVYLNRLKKNMRLQAYLLPLWNQLMAQLVSQIIFFSIRGILSPRNIVFFGVSQNNLFSNR